MTAGTVAVNHQAGPAQHQDHQNQHHGQVGGAQDRDDKSENTCVPVCVSSICFVHLKWVKYQPEIRKVFHIYSLCMDLLNYT